MKSYKGTVAECWMPTFENVAREFITDTLYKLLFSEEIPNFRFDFREYDAINFIENILNSYSDEYDFYKEKFKKILETLKQKSDDSLETPMMIVNDYKQFFELLRQLYEKQIELYFLRTQNSAFTRYEKNNLFEQIWLRATPNDFNNPEEFLRKQVDMVNDNTFQKYDEETCLGKVEFLDNNILCVKNSIARTWDENSREIEFKIYDKDYYNNKELFNRPNYELPVIRYGIYEKDGKRICSIGSIQDQSDSYEKSTLDKKMDRKRYKVNEGIADEDTYKVEPKKLLALSIFINLLHIEGITEIEVPSLYVLDYEYHVKRNKKILSEFEEYWTEDEIKKYPKQYKRAKYYLERGLEKEDLISEIKTERMFKTFKRLLKHYLKGSIKSYPGDIDNCMHLSIPVVRNKKDINGSVFIELYELEKQIDSEIEL